MRYSLPLAKTNGNEYGSLGAKEMVLKSII